MHHVVAAQQPRRVTEAVRIGRRADRSSSTAELTAPAETTNALAVIRIVRPPELGLRGDDSRARRVGEQPVTFASVSRRTRSDSRAGRRRGSPLHSCYRSATGSRPTSCRRGGPRASSGSCRSTCGTGADPGDGGTTAKRSIAGSCSQRRPRVRRRPGWFRRILADRCRAPGRDVRPRRRTVRDRRSGTATSVRCRRGVASPRSHSPEAGQAGAVELGVAAHPVVDAGLERLAVAAVEPRLGGRVALADEHFRGLGVLRLSRQEPTPLDDQDVEADPSAPTRASAAHAGTDDHHIGGHVRFRQCDRLGGVRTRSKRASCLHP